MNYAEMPRLCFMGYRHIRELAMPVITEYRDRAKIEIVEGTFGGALAIARDRIDRGLVDVFISAGSNASILRAGLQIPVATIQLTGFDLLQALIRASKAASRVGVVMYGHTIPELDAVKALLNIEIVQYAYQTPEDARQCFEQLRRDNFQVIIGSSLVVDLAEQAGLHGLLAYSLSSIRRAFDDAIELARVARLEAGRVEQLNGVLHSLQDAVLAVDRNHRLIALNPPMRRLLNLSADNVIGRPLEHLQPELSLRPTLESGQQENTGVQRIGGRDWVVNRAAIRERGVIVGAALTLYDASRIHEADTTLRVQQRRRQHAAKYQFNELIGNSPSFVRAVNTARRYAHTDLTVLISGESGVGKELFAQAIHNESRRANRPFIAVNCASFPESLLESELFGYEEGAFTGSRRGGKQGLFEAAHTGTLFLDEIGDMPMFLQSRLLRVLQEREITRVGSTVAIPIDVRIIAATHQPLRDMVIHHQFRQDLFYRVNTLRIDVPALRDRLEDIAPLLLSLVRRSLGRLGVSMDVEGSQCVASWLPLLHRYPWPGNVRELENISERMAVFLSQYDRVDEVNPNDFRHDCPELYEGQDLAPSQQNDVEGVSLRERALHALDMMDGRRHQAARYLGISRSTLWRWLREE